MQSWKDLHKSINIFLKWQLHIQVGFLNHHTRNSTNGRNSWENMYGKAVCKGFYIGFLTLERYKRNFISETRVRSLKMDNYENPN